MKKFNKEIERNFKPNIYRRLKFKTANLFREFDVDIFQPLKNEIDYFK